MNDLLSSDPGVKSLLTLKDKDCNQLFTVSDQTMSHRIYFDLHINDLTVPLFAMLDTSSYRVMVNSPSSQIKSGSHTLKSFVECCQIFFITGGISKSLYKSFVDGMEELTSTIDDEPFESEEKPLYNPKNMKLNKKEDKAKISPMTIRLNDHKSIIKSFLKSTMINGKQTVLNHGGLVYTYSDKDCLWHTDNDNNTVLHRISDFLDTCQLSDGQSVPVNMKLLNALMEQLVHAIDNTPDGFGVPQKGFAYGKNKLFNISTGESREYRYDDYVTGTLTFNIENQPTPNFDYYLESVKFEPQKLRKFLAMMGAIIALDRTHEKVFILKGVCRSGKGLIMHLLESAVSRHSTVSASSMNDTLYKMIGTNLVSAHDLISHQLNSLRNIVLNLVGNDTISVPRKYRDPVDITVEANLMISVNAEL